MTASSHCRSSGCPAGASGVAWSNTTWPHTEPPHLLQPTPPYQSPQKSMGEWLQSRWFFPQTEMARLIKCTTWSHYIFLKLKLTHILNVLHGACDLFIDINYKCTMCTKRYRNVLQWSLQLRLTITVSEYTRISFLFHLIYWFITKIYICTTWKQIIVFACML